MGVTPAPPLPPKLFALPEASQCGAAMVSYLQDRGIDPDSISRCIGAGLTGMEKIRQAIRDAPALLGRVMRIADNPPPVGYRKDYNEFLTARIDFRAGKEGKPWQFPICCPVKQWEGKIAHSPFDGKKSS